MKTRLLCIVLLFALGTQLAAQMTVKDSDTNVLMQVNDEGDVGSLTLPKGEAPSTTANKLYNNGGSLYWDGDALGTAGSAGGWTDGGTSVYLTTSTDKVGIGDLSPTHTPDVAGKIGIDDTQILFLPDQTDFTGTLIIGNGGSSLSHTTGTTGQFNTAVGIDASNAITTGYWNTSIGYRALYTNTTASNNTACGYMALYSNNSGGNSNTAIGTMALYSNTTGGTNTAVGVNANYYNQGGSRNTLIGFYAGHGTTTHDKSGNVLIGYRAGYYETGDDKLYIENSDISTPLIGGDFSADEIYLNGKVGIGTTSPKLKLSIDNDGGILAKGTYGSGATLGTTGGGSLMIWYPRKGAFRAGYLDDATYYSTFWDDDSIGSFSVAMGYDTKASGEASLAMGQFAQASGPSSIAIGYDVKASAYASTAMGAYVETSGMGSFVIGDVSTTTTYSENTNNKFVARFYNGYRLYTNSECTSGLYANNLSSSWSSISDSTKKENFKPVNGEDVLNKISGFHLGTWNYIGQDPKEFRHYGPMAQDFFNAFGHDGIGVCGNDTLLASADFDGVNFIAVQALEKRTAEDRERIAELEEGNKNLKSEVSELQVINEKIMDANERILAKNEQLELELAEMKKVMADLCQRIGTGEAQMTSLNKSQR
ncbi:tail fiber domain-containing protein [bacterium]